MASYATYGGVNIFGRSIKMQTSDNPGAKQVNAFFGMNGLESLWGGQRGRMTTVTGILFGEEQADLAAAIETFRSYNDGVARPLVDTVGIVYGQVIYASFEQGDRIRLDTQGYWTEYKATFEHL